MPLHMRLSVGGVKVKLFAPAYVPGSGVPAGASFARALEGSQLSAAGVLSYAGANVMREDHYVGGVRTLLLEPASTQLVPYSSPADTTAGRWTNFLMLGQGTFAGPDGIANLAKQTHGNTANTDSAWFIPFALAAGIYRVSLWIQNADDGTVARRLFLTAGASLYSVDLPTVAAWVRKAVTVNTGATAVTNGGFANPSYGNGLSARHFGFQVEVQPVETSYIRNTTGAARVRPMDDLQYPASGTLYEKYYDDAGVLQESIRAYVANTTLAPARPRAYVSLKLGLGGPYTLAQMRAALV